MMLPQAFLPNLQWSETTTAFWDALSSRARKTAGKAGKGDAFESMKAQLLACAEKRDSVRLASLLTQRLAARALTALWLENALFYKQTCNAPILLRLEAVQSNRLTRLTLSNLCMLFFEEFDRLGSTLMQSLGELITRQCRHYSLAEGQQIADIWQVGSAYPWIFTSTGPKQFAELIRISGRELEATFTAIGLTGYASGRFGTLCRACYYLDQLKTIKYGEWHEVMDELLKESVSKASYEEGKLIGHAALEIIIARVEQDAPERWQNFVLSIAGDPRIASSSSSYRTWWQALGVTRINKVRGWLAKVDLKLFLSAVEEYGLQSGKADIQRMFPARRTFLEGLLNLKMIRNTRLMLGNTAAHTIQRMLAAEINISYAELNGSNLNDKAVLYIDCGDFHLIEGSHSFKLWMYLAQPNPTLLSYDKPYFSHFDLTTRTALEYKKAHPHLPYAEIIHNGFWQNKAFSFLAENGIEIDIEQLLTTTDYRAYLRRFGLPHVTPGRSSGEAR